MQDSFKTHYIRVAGTIALIGNAALAFIKILLAYFSKSLAVMGDGIDSSTDVLIAIVTLVISAIISRPSDKEHPWGHGRAETTTTLVLSFIIFFAGAQLAIQSVTRLMNPQDAQAIGRGAVIAAIISIAGKTVLALLQFHYGKIADSEMVKANALNMKNDIIMSLGILVGLFLSEQFKLPILDPIIALLVGLWVIKNAAKLFLQVNFELMDGNADNSLYQKLFSAVSSVQGVHNPHKARIRKMASLFDIDLDIEVDPAMTVYDAHEKAEQVEEAIREVIPEAYDILIHIEPLGSDSHQREEKYGLKPEDM
ncbi:MAG: cation transporter [Treponema sp.]|nr:cation transporter [Treponema sp.]MBQ1726068.1 cation transporter [Treponema sp.]MBQ2356157.1 cation transporter [Treponema sp.]MBQ2548494.1 cation transporter [Treponema sp.]MBQ2572124.1 cation transporter [Treponema sp.]